MLVEDDGNRRRRSVEKEAWWRRQVGEQATSNLSVRAFCEQNRLSEASFYAWRRELAVRDQASTSASVATQPIATTFAEVIVTGAVPTTPTAAIEIILAGERRIAIAPGFDPETLAQVVRVLERESC